MQTITNTQFVNRLCEILGEDFFFSDMIWQEELFEKQDALAKLICLGANSNLPIAKRMVKNFPRVFQVEEV